MEVVGEREEPELWLVFTGRAPVDPGLTAEALDVAVEASRLHALDPAEAPTPARQPRTGGPDLSRARRKAMWWGAAPSRPGGPGAP